LIHLTGKGNQRSYSEKDVAEAFMTIIRATSDESLNIGLIVDGSTAKVVIGPGDKEWTKETASGIDSAWAIRSLIEERFR